jgi:hypothetical protein
MYLRFALLLLLASRAFLEQPLLGDVSGQLTDPQSHVVAAATVILTEQSTQRTWAVQTDTAGHFVLHTPGTGLYTLKGTRLVFRMS